MDSEDVAESRIARLDGRITWEAVDSVPQSNLSSPSSFPLEEGLIPRDVRTALVRAEDLVAW